MKKIYLLGSLNMDLVITCPYVPEAGETLLGSEFMTNPGGKGANQAVACGRLGGNVSMCGCVGDDDFGKTMIENLKNDSIHVEHVRIIPNQTTGVAIILIINRDNRIILNAGANHDVKNGDIDLFLNDAQKDDIFLTQLENPIDVVGYALQQAKKKGLFTILNPAPASKKINDYLPYVDLITPNYSELKLLSNADQIEAGSQTLIQQGIKEVVVTLGDKGYFYTNQSESYYGTCKKVEAIDTTAAGDTFTGALAVELSNGSSMRDALTFASLAATLAVTKKGAQKSIPTRLEVEQLRQII